MNLLQACRRLSLVTLLSAGLLTSCATPEPQKGTPTPIHADGKEGPIMKSAGPMPRKGTPTPIVENSAK